MGSAPVIGKEPFKIGTKTGTKLQEGKTWNSPKPRLDVAPRTGLEPVT